MARKKQPPQFVPLEERPEIIEAMAALPIGPTQVEEVAADALRLYHDAVIAGAVADLERAKLTYTACVMALNGGTHFGSATVNDELMAKHAAPAGQVPRWGQVGQFLLELDGMRIAVEAGPGALDGMYGFDLNAVDMDKPFLSSTGFRHHFMSPARCLGQTVDQALRAEVRECIAQEKNWRPVAIDAEWLPPGGREVPAWLAPALESVTRNGQITLALSGAEPAPDEKPAPLSNAARQRLHRKRIKEREQNEGLKAIPLTRIERAVMSLGLLAHEDLDHRPKDWATTKKRGFDALLAKLWPEGDGGCYLAEPKRSTYRPTAFLREEIEGQQFRINRLEEIIKDLRKQLIQANPAHVVIDEADPNQWTRTVQLTRDDDGLMYWAFSVLFTARADLEHLDSPHVQDRLERIFQGSPFWTDESKAKLDQDQGIINGNKHRDKDAKLGWESYKKERKYTESLVQKCNQLQANNQELKAALQQVAQEVGAAPTVATPAPNQVEAKLREEIAGLRELNATEVADRARAFDAVAVLQERLKKAGLVSDYRRQPGE